MIVIDYSVLSCLFINGPRSAAARRALASDLEWVSAPIWRYQLFDAMAEHMLVEGMTLQTVLQKMAAADFAMRTSHETTFDSEILQLCLESQLLASQVTYVLVARKLGAKLITADSQIAARFPADAVAIESFIAE